MIMTEKMFWQEAWADFKPQKVKNLLYTDLFDKYLKPDSSVECIEIGCFPGNFLIHFRKKFGYKIYGIDYYDRIDLVRKNFEFNEVNEYVIYQEDFLRWTPKKQFDLVFSNGFIEHFQNYEEILEKHVQLLKKEGVIFIGVPNFRYMHFLLRRIFDIDYLKEHNLKVMDLKVLKDFFIKRDFSIHYLGYYGGVGFWIRNLEQRRILVKLILKLVIKLIHLIRRFIKINSKFFSCYLVCIAKKN